MALEGGKSSLIKAVLRERLAAARAWADCIGGMAIVSKDLTLHGKVGADSDIKGGCLAWKCRFEGCWCAAANFAIKRFINKGRS